MNAWANKDQSIPSLEALESRLLLAAVNPTVTLGAVTSSTASLSWNAIGGATACRVYIAPEPPASPGAALPGEVLVATLSGSATNYQITNLAAGIDTYMRVEVDNGGGTGAADVYTKTIGGQLVTLDSNRVREVHMVAPNVLELVYADNINNGVGNDGPTLESGPWTVTRASGSTISVTNTYRFSRPVGQPTTWTGSTITAGTPLQIDNNNVDTDHAIYLVLGANVGSRDVLTIAGPTGINIKFLFSDQYTETPVLQVNQVGYNPRATERWAYIGQWMGDGGGLSLASFPSSASVTKDSTDPLVPRSTQISSLTISVRSSTNDAESGDPVDQIDLSSVPAAEGVRYRVRIAGVGVSWPTAVSEEAAFKAYYTLARGLYYNRWAGDQSSLQWTEFTRPADHVTLPDGTSVVYTGTLADYNQTFPSTQPLTGARTVIGGYHDAGDWDIRPFHTVTPQLLMRAFENNPSNFTDNQLTEPQSGNAIPDLLDEALWGVQAWEALQGGDGGVCSGVQWEGDGCRGYYFSSGDVNPWFTFAEDPQVSARAAGLFAQAAYLVGPYNSARKSQLQTEAINAYNYAKNTNNKDYNGASAAASYLMYGAGELYRLTGNATYKSDFEADWNSLNKYGGGPFDTGVTTDLGYTGDYTDQHRTMPDFLQGYLHGPSPSASIVSVCKSHFEGQSATSITVTHNDHAYRNSRPAGIGLDWGGSTVPNKFMDQTVARMSMGNISGQSLTAQQKSDYFNSLSLDADFILGCNPAGLVYISGLGSRHSTSNLQLDLITFEALGMPQEPGIPEYGPIGAFSALPYYQGSVSAFYPATTNGSNLPAWYRFGDTLSFPSCSEFTNWESMSPLTELFANLLGAAQSPPASYKPGGADALNPLPSFGTATNRAPVVRAGSPQTIYVPQYSVTLQGQVADDHYAGTTLTQTWTKLSGAGTVTFSNANSLTPTATFSMAGIYVLQLQANDTQASTTATVTITVKDPSQGIFNNGNFETGDLTGWTGVSGVSVVANTVGGQGSYVLHVTAGDWQNPALSNQPQTGSGVQQANTSYDLKFKAKFATTTTKTVVVNIMGNGGAAIATTSITGTDTNWHDYTLSFNSGANNHFYISFVHQGGGGNNRDYYLDNVFVLPAGSNTPPNVNAGNDQTITLPTSSVTVTGTVSDDGLPNPPATTTRTWSRTSGPGTVSFGNVNSLSTTATFTVAGTYVLRLTASDSVLTSYDELVVTVNPSANTAPTVNAGVDQTITLPTNSVTLNGTASDDGLPNPPASMTYTWTKTSGGGTVTFGNINAINTTATFSTSGTYVLRLTASDSSLSTYDELTVVVNAAPTNTAPTVGAGNNQTITLPNTANLNGTVSDDGLPNPPATTTATWTMTSGPGTVSFGNVNAPITTASFSTFGTYVLRLTASDSALSNYAETTVTVNQAGSFNWTTENTSDSNTLGLYHFNETSGTTADNAQGNSARDLTLGSSSMITNGTDFLGRNSYFLNTNFGAATSAAAAIPTDYTKGLTISFWMKTADQTAGDRIPVILSNGLGWADENGFAYHPTWTNPYHPKMANVSTTYGDSSDLNTRLLNGAWHNVAVTHNASNTAKLYIDNVLMTSWTDSGGSNLATAAELYVGNALSGLNIYVDELLIEQSELTDFSKALGATSNHAPVAVADSYTVNENNQLIVNAPGVLTNDTDADSDPLTAAKVTDVTHGALTLNSNGSFTYTPSSNWYGTDSFTYKVNDGKVDGNTVTVNLTVPDVPAATPDNYTVSANATLTVSAPGVLSNDVDPASHALTASVVTNPAHGTLTLNSNGSFTYTPSSNWYGTDSFSYKAYDGTTYSNVASATITVTDIPVATADSYGASENTPLVVATPGVLSNDTDPAGLTLTAIDVTNPSHGSLTLNASGSFTYTPTVNWYGTDSFTYKVSNGTTSSNTVTVTLTVDQINLAPVVSAGNNQTINLPVTATLVGTVTDDGLPAGGTVTSTWSMTSGPATVSFGNVNAANTTATFSVIGTYVLRLTASDSALSSYAETTITVNPAPSGFHWTVENTSDSNTLGLYHFNETSGTTADNAQGNSARDLTLGSSSMITNGTDFLGRNSYFLNTNFGSATSAAAAIPTDYTKGLTISFWMKTSDQTGSADRVPVVLSNGIGWADENGFVYHPTWTNPYRPKMANVATTYGGSSDINTRLLDGNWHNVAVTHNASTNTAKLYIDNVQLTSWTDSGGSNLATAAELYVGNALSGLNIYVDELLIEQTELTDFSNARGATGNHAPVATADSYSTNEDTPLTVAAAGVLSNDTDSDSDPLTAIKVADVTHGTLTLNSNGSFTYTPSANWNGTDSFTYKVNDGKVDGNTVTVTLTVNAVNDAPVATGDSYTTNEDTPLIVSAPGVLTNDTDVDNDTLTAIKVTDPAHGTLTLGSNGGFTYTPSANYNGPDSFTYKANDSHVDSNTVTVNITVASVNDAPVAVADSYSTNENTPLTVAAAGVLSNDTDVDGDTLTAIKVTDPAHGAVTLGSNGSFTYTPSSNWYGTDSFTYKANDGALNSNTVTVTLTVNHVNQAPVAGADNYSVNENAQLVVNAPGVLGNDTDVDGDALTATKVTDPAHGTLTFNSNGSFTYTPSANWYGTDSFTYKANDGALNSNTVTVTLTVNHVNQAPVATADSYSANENSPLTVAAAGVLSNDTDVDGDTLTAVKVSDPSHGTLTLNSNGGFTYTPTTNWYGTDSFTYKASDGVLNSGVVTVTLTVAQVNLAPVVNAGSNQSITQPNTAILNGSATDDGLPNGSTLTYTWTKTSGPGTVTFGNLNQAVTTASFSTNGTYVLRLTANDSALSGYAETTVTANAAGSFNWNAENTSDSNTLALYHFNESSGTTADNAQGNSARDVTLGSASMITNGTDFLGRSSYFLNSSFGTATSAAGAIPTDYTKGLTISFWYKCADQTGADRTPVSLNNAGFQNRNGFVYHPTWSNPYRPFVGNIQGFYGATTDINTRLLDGNWHNVALTHRPQDNTARLYVDNVLMTSWNDSGGSNLSSTAQLVVGTGLSGINAYVDELLIEQNEMTDFSNALGASGNHAPVAWADSYSLNENASLTVSAPGVLSNDTDGDSNSLTAVKVSDPTHGTVTLGSNGSFTYTPSTNWYGTDSFTYQANDGYVNGNTVAVTLNVASINHAPVATADSYTANENTALTVAAAGVLSNDTDLDGDTLTAIKVTDPSHGTLTLGSNGSFTYTPSTNWYGTDSFTYKANDSHVDSNTVTVTLTVNHVNQAPVATADSYSTNENTPLTVAAAGVLSNDTDVDVDTLSATLVTGAAHGTVALNSNGGFTYVPPTNWYGTDTFTYKAYDGALNSNTVTVTLTVNHVNQAPVAVADSYTTNENSPLTVAAAGVLSNDTDVDGDTITAVKVADPSHGTVTLGSNGSFTYTPSTNWYGTDSFTYKANDGALNSNTVTVTLTVNHVNQTPVAVADSYSTNENTPLTVAAAGVLSNDTDVDGDTLTAILVSGTSHGSVTLGSNGSFTYTASTNWYGTDSFTYKAYDGALNSNTVTVTLTVNHVNQAPVAAGDAYSTNEDTQLIVSAPGVLTNDTDVDGDSITAVKVTDPAHGTVTFNSNGSFTYTPSTNWNGTDSFTYKAYDGALNSNVATVNIVVNPINDAPVATNDSYVTPENTALTISAPGALSNDTDVDGDTLTAIGVTNPSHGTLTLGSNGSFTYTPTTGYTGSDSFTYKANDGLLNSNTATVSLTVGWTRENNTDGNTLALYHFNETSGTTANDASSYARNATLGSSSMITNGTDFLGRSSYFLNVNYGTALSAAGAIPTVYSSGLTISFWMKTSNQANANYTPVALNNAGYMNQNMFQYHPTWTLPYRPAMANVQTTYGTSADLNARLLDGNWHNVAVTHDPSNNTAKLYIDNVQLTSWTDSGGTNLSSTAQLVVGTGYSGVTCYIDELLIEQRVMTSFSNAQ